MVPTVRLWKAPVLMLSHDPGTPRTLETINPPRGFYSGFNLYNLLSFGPVQCSRARTSCQIGFAFRVSRFSFRVWGFRYMVSVSVRRMRAHNHQRESRD